jgi:dephospho-CoA kinase
VLLVALTGGIGSGKSLAGEYFDELGAIVVDSDQLARDVIERGTPGFDEVIAEFGDEILSQGVIDRKKLGEIVFSDEVKRKKLESILHPLIRIALDEVAQSAPAGSIVINQIPLLAETGGKDRFDLVITVSTDLKVRRERLLARGLAGYEIDKRLAAQVSDAEREAIADYVLTNHGDKDALLRQVESLWTDVLLPKARQS